MNSFMAEIYSLIVFLVCFWQKYFGYYSLLKQNAHFLQTNCIQVQKDLLDHTVQYCDLSPRYSYVWLYLLGNILKGIRNKTREYLSDFSEIKSN